MFDVNNQNFRVKMASIILACVVLFIVNVCFSILKTDYQPYCTVELFSWIESGIRVLQLLMHAMIIRLLQVWIFSFVSCDIDVDVRARRSSSSADGDEYLKT